MCVLGNTNLYASVSFQGCSGHVICTHWKLQVKLISVKSNLGRSNDYSVLIVGITTV